MINVSNQFRKDMQTRRDFYVTASCTLSDGTNIELQKKDFYVSGNGFVDSSDSSDFPLGIAIEKTATLSLVNDDDRFSEYNFSAARLVIFLNFDISKGLSEKIRLGTYIVLKKPATSAKINLTLVDRMHYADTAYSTKLIFPTTAGAVLRDSCQTCGIALGDATFPNDDFVINEAPASTTHRAVIGCIAMLAGGNARIDENDYLRIKQFDRSIFDANYDGGTFKPWTTGSDLDGGTFKPWTTGKIIDGGSFTEMKDYHVIYKIKGLQIDTDDVEVTGVKTIINQLEYQYGNDGYVVKIDNMLISGNEEDALQRIGNKIIGLKMRPFSCQHTSYPLATFMDAAYVVDNKDRIFETYLTNIEFTFNSYTNLSNTAQSAVQEETEFNVPSNVAVEKAKRDTDKKLSEYDIAVRNMNELAANTLGYFSTDVFDKTGARVTYWHDKPNLSESKIVYKKGISGFFVTTDFQGTDEATTKAGKWSSGFNSNGDAYLNILYAIGIAAEWINTRGLTARDNKDNITFRIDPETGAVTIIADSFSLSSGQTIDSIAQSKADSALSNAKNYADNAAKNAINSQSQTDILNKLTNGGKDNGIYLLNGKLYISFSAMRGDELTLGGSKNVNGLMKILNASGVQVGKWDNTGIEAIAGKIGGWTIASNAIYNGLTYTGQENSNSTGIGDYGGNWAFWAGNGKFNVNQSGHLHASDADISGNISANTGTFTNITINGSTINSSDWHVGTLYDGYVNGGTLQNSTTNTGTITNSGTINGGTMSNAYIASGALTAASGGNYPGGTYVGTCRGSTLSSCGIGGTSLSSSGGYIQADGVGVNIHASGGVLLWRGSLNAGYTASGWRVAGNMYCSGNLSCGGTKPRTMKTKHFGERQLDALETPVPTFSDYGKAILDKNGEFYIIIDPIFAETVNEYYMPTVFLTKYGQGDIWVDDNRTTHDVVVVCGTPNLKFAWETKYHQGNCYQDRLRIKDFDEPYVIEPDFNGDANVEWEHNDSNVDYANLNADIIDFYNRTSINYANEGYEYFKSYERSLIA